ncbi:hypothetical protein HMPREF9413_6033 [Paenibacillus sp. HGF7]|nr:hypothetical protein HMPREF9413_6033 [Paenibacillus sp. HGF7]
MYREEDSRFCRLSFFIGKKANRAGSGGGNKNDSTKKG